MREGQGQGANSATRGSGRYRRARPIPPPVVPLSRVPLSAILSHLELTRRTLANTDLRRREAGGEAFLREMERRYVAELEQRQLRITLD